MAPRLKVMMLRLLFLHILFIAPNSVADEIEESSTGQPVTYAPGRFSAGRRSTDNRVLLSDGLLAKPIAQAGEYVQLANDTRSATRFHKMPDAAHVFPLDGGRWLYVSNAENVNRGTNWTDGGVGAIEFNRNGEVIGYKKIANYTSKNCGGGAPPWNSWVSGEEVADGRFVQIDPFGMKPPVVLEALGSHGFYESIAHDSAVPPRFYTTRDATEGIVTRFTPDERGHECFLQPDDYDRWCTLESGTLDYLYLKKDDGHVEWTNDLQLAMDNSKEKHPNSEGINIQNNLLYFTAKLNRMLFTVNLETLEYQAENTGFEPDQMARIEGDDKLYLCEEGGDEPGLHIRYSSDHISTILRAIPEMFDTPDGATEETTGIAFSPDNMHLYVAFQEVGIVYDVTRDDKLSFRDEMIISGSSSQYLLLSLILGGCVSLLFW